MSEAGRTRKIQWLRHVAWVSAVAVFLVLTVLVIFLGSGAGDPLIRRVLVRRLQALTGGRVELRTMSIDWLSLRAKVKGLEIHGLEPAGTEPLFAAEEVDAGLRIDSWWGRKVSLGSLIVRQPHVHIRIEKNGLTNLPTPRRPRSAKPLAQTVLDLHIQHLKLENGWVLYNDVQAPLAVEGDNLHLTLDASGPLDHSVYEGNLDWQNVTFTAQRFLPIPIGVSAKFTISLDGFTLQQGIVRAGRSHLDAQAELINFTDPRWSLRYRGWLELLDLREILRNPLVPTGRADVHGEGTFAGGQFHGTGIYAGRDIALPYDDFHARGLTSHGTFTINNDGLVVPDFYAGALGGTVKGRVTLQFAGLQFHAETHVQGVRLANLLPSIEHHGFPIDELHWDADLTADTKEDWTGAFEHFGITAKMHWAPPENVAAGHEAVKGDWQFIYKYDTSLFTVVSGAFQTPTTNGSVSGLLAPRDSGMDLKFETTSLERYKDFINALRDVSPRSAEAKQPLSGKVSWDGKITGPSGKPTFSGHVRGENVQYSSIVLDSLDGELVYSPRQLLLSRGHTRRGPTSSSLEITLELTNWSFLPENSWSANASLEKTSLEGLQQLLGWSYPVRGSLTGEFHGRGTRAEPTVTGLFDLADGSVYGSSFNRLRGQLTASTQEVRIANAELRFFASGKEKGRGAGIVTGTAAYRFADKTIAADLVGAALPLESFNKLQSSIALGGQVTFRLKADGPIQAPIANGTFHVTDLRVGQEVIGSFDTDLASDGKTARLTVSSAMSTGEISGGYTLGLANPFPVEGKVSIKNIDLDPFLLAALHLKEFSGHGKADGDISMKGALKDARGIVVEANFSRLILNYANVQLENSGPVRFRSSREALEIEPVVMHGTDTNVKIDGSVQFTGRRNLALHLDGAVDLRLLNESLRNMDVHGGAQINAAVEGSIDHPRITGRVHIDNASVRAADFPTGLSAIKGDLIFDTTRLFFSDVTAEVGGGTLQLSGSVNYGESGMRYDLNTSTERVRIRYPEGMSWLLGGNLRLTGTTNSGIVSGRVTVQRVLLTQGLESAGVLVSSKEGISGPTTDSPFLRNLQFDIEAVSSPDARMEWPGAELEADANLRVRGTWEHPIILGHIHLLSGDLYFAGNRYRVARGDINFANPFRLDPVVNVEASTTVQQYEVTLNFNGPASKLSLAYRSDPPLPSNDIVALLAMGQRSAEGTSRSGGTAQSATSGATALLSEAVSSQLGGRLQRLFGITRLRVDPGLTPVASSSSQNAGARVTVEQQIARNLTIMYVSNVGSTQEQVIQVEYTINRNISVVALRDQNGTFGIDVKIRKRFK
ncbi:MAG TPA: translocation/assembly module TamB domain-containing protein [Candidatus Acidoferrum sp.]|jgi:translocation and assembly module TamB|nr:translocation/assembly module TamB domain-containing protein [Candidatus Acidoferrum sp.]